MAATASARVQHQAVGEDRLRDQVDLLEELDLEPGAGSGPLVPRTFGVDEEQRIAEAPPEVGAPARQTGEAHEHGRRRPGEATWVEPPAQLATEAGRSPLAPRCRPPGRARRRARSIRRSAPSRPPGPRCRPRPPTRAAPSRLGRREPASGVGPLEHHEDETDGHGDAGRPRRGDDEAHQAGEPVALPLDQHEGGEDDHQEERVAVDRAVQVPGVGVQRAARAAPSWPPPAPCGRRTTDGTARPRPDHRAR